MADMKNIRSTVIILFCIMLGHFAISAKAQACDFVLQSETACQIATYYCEVVCASKYGVGTLFRCHNGGCYCCADNLKMVTS